MGCGIPASEGRSVPLCFKASTSGNDLVSPAPVVMTATPPAMATVLPAVANGVNSVDEPLPRQSTVRRLNLVGAPEEAIDVPVNRDNATVFAGNWLASNRLSLTYDAPNMDDDGVCINFSDDDLEEETQKWEHSLVTYVIGAEHTLGYMEVFLEKVWDKLVVHVIHQFDAVSSLLDFCPGQIADWFYQVAPILLRINHLCLRNGRRCLILIRSNYMSYKSGSNFLVCLCSFGGK